MRGLKSQLGFASIFFAALITGCTQKANDPVLKNYVSLNSKLPVVISDDQHSFKVSSQTVDAQPTLVVDFPKQLIGEEYLFGSTITEVSDHEDENLGGMKMAGIGPHQVKSQMAQDAAGNPVLQLKTCMHDCTDLSERTVIAAIPVLKQDANTVTLDLASFGKTLSFFEFMKIEGEDPPKEWVFESAATRSVDYSLSTLVFEVVSTYKPSADSKRDPAYRLSLTNRWYLQIAATGTPFFTSRAPLKEVGYFTSDRGGNELITRFRAPTADAGSIKYYIKNVPQEYRPGFVEAFEAWNQKLQPLFHMNFFTYEFLEDNDPRAQVIVTGDVRYNVIEWDLVNQASYGGLGPSIADSRTGEVLSAQVLIQGPTIEKMYKSWFFPPAEKQPVPPQARVAMKMKFGDLELRVPSQDPTVQDRLETRMDFYPPPAGFNYDDYMRGYFRDMVAHEVGHNMGLRHNFRGSLANDNSKTEGSVSRSIMEYLNASYRHLDTVGDYDLMAISYGYLGTKPAHADWYCTDEDSDAGDAHNSAECNSDDATSDPFSFFQNTLQQVMAKSVALGEDKAPDWTPEDLRRQVDISVNGLARYASSAVFSASTWTNFFTDANRPKDAVKIPQYVIGEMSKLICGDEYSQAAQKKTDPAVQAKTLKNLTDLRSAIADVLKTYKEPFPLKTAESFPCL